MVVAVTEALQREPAFTEQVVAVRCGAHPRHEAAPYGDGRRRDAIATLIELAAWDRRHASYRLANAAGVTACSVGDDNAPRRGTTYRFRRDFLVRLERGAEGIARRGAGKCVGCGIKLAGDARSMEGRSSRRDFCQRCTAGRNAAHAPDIEDTIRPVFEVLIRALNGDSPRPPGARGEIYETYVLKMPVAEPQPGAARKAWERHEARVAALEALADDD